MSGDRTLLLIWSLALIVAFDLSTSTQLVASMSLVEGPFRAFWTLASKSEFHNATTRFFTPKLMTMVSAGAMWEEYLPDGSIHSGI
jgi:hypothetical protein